MTLEKSPSKFFPSTTLLLLKHEIHEENLTKGLFTTYFVGQNEHLANHNHLYVQK